MSFRSPFSFAINWQRRLNDISDARARGRILMALMMSAGCIKPYKGGGELCEFGVRMRQGKPTGFEDGVPPQFDSVDSIRMLRLNWAAYHFGKRLGVLELARNQGAEAFKNLFQLAMDEVTSAFDRFGEFFYQDLANPPGGERSPMAGFYTLLNLYSNSTAAASQGYKGKVRLMSGTYGLQSVNLGVESTDFRGENGLAVEDSGDFSGYYWWPVGVGDPAYDYLHPMLINTGAGRTSGLDVWGPNPAFNELYCEEMLDFGIVWSRSKNGMGVGRTGATGAEGGQGDDMLILSSPNPMLTIKKRFASTYRTLVELTNGAKRTIGGIEAGFNVHMLNGAVLADDHDMAQFSNNDLIGLRLKDWEYQQVGINSSGYKNPTGSVPIMSPYHGVQEGGVGEILGGLSYGQLCGRRPRGLTGWRDLA